MSWEHRCITDWSNFLEIVAVAERYGTAADHSMLVRGQADWEWELRSSLVRWIGSDASQVRALQIEAAMLARFKEAFPQSAPGMSAPADDQLFEWWALMQHYGAPTRLLDWTTSLHVAAYFAAVDNWDNDGAIWVLSPWVVFEAAKLLIDPELPLETIAQQPSAPPVVVALPPKAPTDRMAAQQGYFTLSLDATTDQGRAIEDMFANGAIEAEGQLHLKLLLSKATKRDFLDNLHAIGISARTIYPGLDGLGKSLTEYARIAR